MKKKYNNIKAILIKVGDTQTYILPLFVSQKARTVWTNTTFTKFKFKKSTVYRWPWHFPTAPLLVYINPSRIQEIIDAANSCAEAVSPPIKCQDFTMIFPKE